MNVLNERWSRELLPRLRTRVGIDTGIAVAGNMGTDRIFNSSPVASGGSCSAPRGGCFVDAARRRELVEMRCGAR